MARTVLVAKEGYVNISGDLYGKKLYPAEGVSTSNVLELSDSDFDAMINNDDNTLNEPSFWKDFQNEGQRTDYSYAFANWNATSIKPLYGLNNVDKCMYALMNCKQLLDARTLTFNITNSNPQMQSVCANCNSMTHAPQFIFSAAVIRSYTSMYAACTSLESATVYWGDGSTDPVTVRSSCQNMFFKCKSLTSIDFGKPNTGSPLYLDLSACVSLSQSSVESLANSLKSIPEGSAGNYEITLATATNNAMSDATRQIFTDKGWTIKTK